MRVVAFISLAALLLLFTMRGNAQVPAVSGSTFYSTDEYQRAHFLFNKLAVDLNAAQNSTPTEVIGRARTDLNALENSWDRGVYDSRQMHETVLAVEAAVDNTPRLRDRTDLGDDASRLLDLQREYY